MQLSELRKRTSPHFSQPMTVAPQGDERLVVDKRCALKPAECVERKLVLLLGDQYSIPSGERSEVEWDRE